MQIKVRSLKSQLNHAISSAYTQTSKRADRLNPQIDTKSKLYSINRTESLRDLANSFSKFMAENHPDVRMVKDITREHTQEYIISREEQWSERTAQERISQFAKLERIVNDRFGCKSNLGHDLEATPKKESTRDKAMQRADYDKIRQEAQDSTSPARDGLELGARFGLRACEVCGLRAEEIDLDRGVLHIGDYAKGGKHRDIPIREKDREYAKDLKERAGEGRCVPLKVDSYNRQVRRYMERSGVARDYKNTTEHAIRKMYVKERMEELRGTEAHDPRTDKTEKEAWCVVQQELGHGEKFRSALYNAYVK